MNQSATPFPTGPAGFGPPSGGPSKFSPIDPVRVLKQYKWVFLAAAVLGILVGVAAYFVLVRFAPVFTAAAYVSVEQEVTNPMEVDGGSARESEDQFQRFQATQALAMGGADIMNAVLGRQEIKATDWYQRHADLSPGELMRELGKAVKISVQPDTNLIKVTARMFSREDPHVFANTVVDEFLRKLGNENSLEGTGLRQMYTQQANQLRLDIERREDRLDEVILDAELSVVQNNYHEIQALFQALVDECRELSSMIDSARANYEGIVAAREAGPVEFTADEIYSVKNDPKVRAIDQTIINLNQGRISALERYGPRHRVIEEIDVGIRAAEIEKERVMQELLIELQDTKVSSAAAQLKAAESQYASATARLEQVRVKRRELNQQLSEHQRLKDELEKAQERLAEFESLQTEMEMKSRRPDRDRVKRHSTATRPELRSSPKLVQTVLGVEFLVLAFVAGLVFLRELLDSRIKGPACSKLLPKADLIGVIPDSSEDPHVTTGIEGVVRDHPDGLLAEQFRQLRTEVLNRLDDRRYKTLMLTGSQPGCGVSSMTVNLGSSIAANGRKVVLFEANFRRPALGNLLGLPGEVGAAEVLTGDATLDDAVQASGVTGMDVITIGNGDGHFLELLESQAFSKLIRDLEERYDVILVDAPPMSIVGDSRVLANRVQTVLLVVRAMVDKRGLVARIINQLKSSRADLIGIVINGVRSSAGGYFRRNFEAYYAYQNGGRVGESQPSRSRKGGRRRSEQSTNA